MAMTVWLAQVFGLPITSELISIGASQINKLFIVYGVGFVAMCTSIVLLNLHAWRLRDSLQLSELERYDTRSEIGAWVIVGSAGVLSIVLALATPPSWAGLPGWAYMLLSIVMPVYGTMTGRRRRAIAAAQ